MGSRLISVAMGVLYLSEDISNLKRSVGSILSQTFSDFEFLICAKRLSEKAENYLRSVAQQDDRIVLIDGSSANHLGGQLNLCVERAKGKYIARMDDDDFSHPRRLEIQLEFLKSNPDIAFVGCDVRLLQEGRDAGKRVLPRQPVVKDFLFVQPFIHPSLMFRKEALESIKGYSDAENTRGCEDYDLLLRLYENGCCGVNLEEPLLDYTLPPTGKSKRAMRLRVNETKTRFRLFKRLGLMPKAFPYAIKPIAVGLIPNRALDKVKKKCYEKRK